jgi:hypothetical protein|tara:strand:- start:2000 stop:2128 length:129 start_codon:yes stop_codon:yes gene_type:complete
LAENKKVPPKKKARSFSSSHKKGDTKQKLAKEKKMLMNAAVV